MKASVKYRCFQSINQKIPYNQPRLPTTNGLQGDSLVGYEVLLNLDELGGFPQNQHQGAI